ncbi:MAG: hypothetical protein AAFQ39_08140, partial [Pseudomonadota bacterium]
RPDVAPLAYEVIILASAYDHLDRDGISDFLNGANQDIFEELFRSCNGLRIGATKFGVFGFTTGNQSVGVPWNIETPNDATRAQRPTGTLVVGTSNASIRDGSREKCYHTIQSEPTIHVTPENDFSDVLRSYTSVAEWLASEVALAMHDRANW